MFGQVLICVLRGSSGIHYSSLGVGVGGGVALLGGDWGQDLPPAFTDMCHLWWRRLKPIWGVLLSASQESNPEGEREQGEADSSARQSWSAVWSEVSQRCRHQGKVYRNIRGTEARLIVHFPVSFLLAPPLNTCHPLKNSASGRSLCWKAAFSSALYCFCFFFSSFSFYFFPISFSSESRRWDNDQVKLVLC